MMKNNDTSNSRTVYSTDRGRIAVNKQNIDIINDDNRLIILKREVKKRGGKSVVVIEGCPTSMQASMLKQLKKRCACGGSIKATTIEIQGEHRDKIKQFFEQQQFTVKLSGG